MNLQMIKIMKPTYIYALQATERLQFALASFKINTPIANN